MAQSLQWCVNGHLHDLEGGVGSESAQRFTTEGATARSRRFLKSRPGSANASRAVERPASA